MRRAILAGVVVGLVSLTACAPPRASSVKGCRNGTGIVYVKPAVACPAHGWFVLDPALGGAQRQSFPYGTSLTTSTGTPRLDYAAQGVTFIRTFWQRQADGTYLPRATVAVVGPRFMLSAGALGVGTPTDSHIAPLP